MTDTEVKLITVLVADDDPEDRMLTLEVLGQLACVGDVYCVQNGQELLDCLHGRARFVNMLEARDPDVILLDLQMPKKDGFQVLEELHLLRNRWQMRVIVLTGSTSTRDRERAHALGADAFLEKPLTLQSLTTTLAE